MQGLSTRTSGILFAVGAFGAWGFFPLYFRQFHGISPLEILLHRSAWAVPFLALVLASGAGSFRAVRAALGRRRDLLVLVASASLLAANWLLFIWAIQIGRVLECALGYYINPLLSVALGVLVLGERLTRLQLLAIVLAALGVAVLAWRGETFPWIALTLAVSFAVYGLLRKTMRLGAAEGLLAENLIMLPFMLTGIAWLALTGQGGFLHQGLGSDLLLASTGVVTATALVFFAAAARRLPLSAIGMFQYSSPTLQFLMAVFLFGEHFSDAHAITFTLIWTAVGLFVFETWRKGRRAGPRAPQSDTPLPLLAGEDGERSEAR